MPTNKCHTDHQHDLHLGHSQGNLRGTGTFNPEPLTNPTCRDMSVGTACAGHRHRPEITLDETNPQGPPGLPLLFNQPIIHSQTTFEHLLLPGRVLCTSQPTFPYVNTVSSCSEALCSTLSPLPSYLSIGVHTGTKGGWGLSPAPQSQPPWTQGSACPVNMGFEASHASPRSPGGHCLDSGSPQWG